jgi:hypothetical protein
MRAGGRIRGAARPAISCPHRGLFSIGIGAAPRLYQLTTETGMPHLEQNLRYAITHDNVCLGRDPMLWHAAVGSIKKPGSAKWSLPFCIAAQPTGRPARCTGN